MIGIFLDNLPALLFGMQATDAQLVGNGGVTLIVGRIAGVQCNLHGTELLFSGAGRATLLQHLQIGLPRGTTSKQANQLD
ncbi:hypothetical protein J2W40_003559 [Sphingobium xenophagum]|uniref:Uncharacterized protein n=1 Tax=Sphingobium xenophagum TaxID=121428 RepID=A0ABU1X5Z6_SPHXE|nr:hypothetical protein [Sphingobium xenophagum]MDR7156714.1 hypothetical protein [Sphingobium xenophagum]